MKEEAELLLNVCTIQPVFQIRVTINVSILFLNMEILKEVV